MDKTAVNYTTQDGINVITCVFNHRGAYATDT
jgi:hypothetical protein